MTKRHLITQNHLETTREVHMVIARHFPITHEAWKAHLYRRRDRGNLEAKKKLFT